MNAVLENMSGAIGDLVFRRRAGRVIVARKPEYTNRHPSASQLAHAERFRQAAAYAKAALADAILRPIYDAASKEKGVQPYPLAVGDYLNAPTVDAIVLDGYTGKAGEHIGIRASDDIEVVSVTVSIRTEKGAMEHGGAVLEQGVWRYTTRSNMDLASGSVAIDVTVMDRPGNKTTKTEVKQP